MSTKRVARWQRWLYSQFPLIGGWIRRWAAKALARDGSPAAVRALSEAVTRNADERVRVLALETLRHLNAQPSIDAACDVWAATRHADLTRVLAERRWVASAPVALQVLTALKLQQREVITGLGPEVVTPLLTACRDADSAIAQQARLAIGDVRRTDVRDALTDQLCEQWVATRAPQLEEIMVQGHYVAHQPLAIRVLSALKTQQPHLLSELGSEVIEPLLQACEDGDPSMREQARLTLQHLQSMEAREALCRVVIDRDHVTARDVALAANYAPRDEYQRALFFFLTEQWDRYDALDFDRRLLSTVYESASLALRQRITEKLRLAGRTDFLAIVAGKDSRSRVAVMTSDETACMVQMLADHKEWTRLWDLVFVLPFSWSVRIVEMLVQHAWKPKSGDEQQTFATLGALVANDMVTTSDIINRSLPPAVQQAHARVSGRVNDVAFSPICPVIAIGTGQRKLVLWNFQHAQREQVFNGFQHAIGRVTFTRDDTLLCAERTRGDAACTIHGWCKEKRFSLEPHQGSVTALVPLGASQLLATGRDHRVTVWDVDTGQKVQEKRFHFWARAACLSPDEQRAALLHNGMTLVTLPHLTPLAQTAGRVWHGVARCAAFPPHGEALLIGRHAGGILMCECAGQSLRQIGRPFVTHPGHVQAIEVLRHRAVVITAAADGSVRFTDWANHAVIGEVQVPGQRLTSLHISPNGAFMAIGDSDASMSLWDLRVLDIPMLFTRPFAHAVPIHLAAVSALAGNGNLPTDVQHALQFMACVLRHRFRYDVEVDAVPTIRAGEFDIALEE